jgi:hypothetical protein
MTFGVSIFHYRPELPLAWTLGVFFLFAFYRSISSKWPENYFAFDSQTDPIISKSLLHYLGYRMFPVYVTCLFVSVSLDRANIAPWHGWSAATRGVAGVTIGHLALTNVRGLLTLAKRRFRQPRDIGIGTIQLGVIATVIFGASTALIGRAVMAPLIPRSNDLSVALWTGVVVAAMGGWLIDATRGTDKPIERRVTQSAKSIPPDLIAYAKQRCLATNTDWFVFYAVMLYENLQRPPWIRRIERMSSRLRTTGTYGIMQTRASAPITDMESIDVALNDYLGGFQFQPTSDDDETFTDHSGFLELLKSYNQDENYAYQVLDVYQTIVDRQ